MIKLKRFTLPTGRHIVEPPEPLKSQLKELNNILLDYYENVLTKNHIQDIPQAYRKNHSIKTNAYFHQKSHHIHKFDFTHFYDSIPYHLIKPHLQAVNAPLRKDYYIDPLTNGLIQGSPVSGTLAGLVLVPFWIYLQRTLPHAVITQYSDDLAISNSRLSQKKCEQLVINILKQQHIPCSLNSKKTTTHTTYRKITGVTINHNNVLTISREKYRNLRAILHGLKYHNKTIHDYGFESYEQFMGLIGYYLHIDDTHKIQKLLDKYEF